MQKHLLCDTRHAQWLMLLLTNTLVTITHVHFCAVKVSAKCAKKDNFIERSIHTEFSPMIQCTKSLQGKLVGNSTLQNSINPVQGNIYMQFVCSPCTYIGFSDRYPSLLPHFIVFWQHAAQIGPILYIILTRVLGHPCLHAHELKWHHIHNQQSLIWSLPTLFC